MSSKISLKSLEKKVFQRSFQDGTVDIQIGCLFLMLAIAPNLSIYMGDFWASAVFLPFFAAVYLLLRSIKRKYIQPRIGVVEYGSYRKSRLKRMTLVMLVFNLAALLLGIFSFLNFSTTPGWMVAAIFSILVLMGFSLAGYLLEFPRLYLYGVITSLAFPVGEFLYSRYQVPHHGIPVTFGVVSGSIILTGIIILYRVLKVQPSSPQDSLHD